jgi:hypothetical protein
MYDHSVGTSLCAACANTPGCLARISHSPADFVPGPDFLMNG